MTAQTDIEEKALHWFVVLRDDDAPESAWLEFQDWLEASPTHAAAYDAVELLWVDLEDHAASAPAEAPVIDFATARARRGKARSPWLGAAIGIAASVTLAVGLFLWLTPGSQIYATTDAPPDGRARRWIARLSEPPLHLGRPIRRRQPLGVAD